jgi:hypothetical protein
MTQPDSVAEAEARRQEQIKEYGTYVAVVDISHGNAVAYRAGHPVPISNVERWGYDKLGYVAKVDEHDGEVVAPPVVPGESLEPILVAPIQDEAPAAKEAKADKSPAAADKSPKGGNA